MKSKQTPDKRGRCLVNTSFALLLLFFFSPTLAYADQLAVRITGGLEHYTVVDLDRSVVPTDEHSIEVDSLPAYTLKELLLSHVLGVDSLDSTYVELLLGALHADMSQATFDNLRVITGAAGAGTRVYALIANQYNQFSTITRRVGHSGVFSLDIPLYDDLNQLLLVFVQDGELSALFAVLNLSSNDFLENLLQFTPRLPGDR